MKKKGTLLSILPALFIMFGCGSAMDSASTEASSADNADREVLTAALLGGAGGSEAQDAAQVTSEVEASVNAAVAKNLSEKVEAS